MARSGGPGDFRPEGSSEEALPPRTGAAYVLVAPVAACLLLLAAAVRFHPLTADDAFITYRYAENIVAGHGPVWNEGERVEGYTNFLWMMLLAALSALGADVLVASKVLGVACAVGIVFEASRLARAWPWTYPFTVPLALGLLALGPWISYWSTQGMETPLYAYLLVLSVRLFLQDAHRPATRRWKSPFALCLLAMTRPEGLMVAGIVGIVALLGSRPGERLRLVAVFAAPFLLLYAPYFAWRVSYYGELLPNTFYAKTAARWDLVERGLGYVGTFVRAVGPAWLLFGLKPAFGGMLRTADRLVLAIVLPYAAYVALVGGDYMKHHRFLMPLLPLLAVMLADGMVEAVRWARRRLPLPAAALVAIYAALLAAPVSATWKELGEAGYDRPMGPKEADARVGLYLRRTAPPGASLATTTIGKVGYYSGLRVQDLLGLTEPAVAHMAMERVGVMAGHDKMDISHALAKRPTFFYFRAMIPNEGRGLVLRDDPIVTAVERPKAFLHPDLKRFEPEFNEKYRAVHLDFGDLAFDMYVRRDVAWPPAPSR